MFGLMLLGPGVEGGSGGLEERSNMITTTGSCEGLVTDWNMGR